jgi:hypothetical protein
MKHLALLSAAVVTACVIASMPFDIGHADDETVPIFGKNFSRIPRLEADLRGARGGRPQRFACHSWQRCRDQGLAGRDGSVPGRHNHCAVGLEL